MKKIGLKIGLASIFSTLLFPFVLSATSSPSPKKIQEFLQETQRNMSLVKGGSFQMGDVGNWTHHRDDNHVHEVELDSFWMGKSEITYREYDFFTRTTGRKLRFPSWLNPENRKPNLPVGAPSWYEAQAYCQWLKEESKLPYDLPTEAQWEYAARNRGQKLQYATDNGKIDYGRNYRPQRIIQAYPQSSFPPNPLGIEHLTGNVAEWVQDWYAKDYYKKSPIKNPQGPPKGTKKVKRGGSFIESAGAGMTVKRFPAKPSKDGYDSLGFRCVLNQP